MALWDHVRNGERTLPGRAGTQHDFAWSDGPAFLRGSFGPPRSSNDNQRGVFDEGPADELDCLRRVLAPELLRAAEARARELGIGADQVLIHQGVIDEDAYLQRLAFHTGIAIENFSEIGRGDSLLRDREILQAAELGLIRASPGRPPDLDAGAAAPCGTHALPACRRISRPDRVATARIILASRISFCCIRRMTCSAAPPPMACADAFRGCRPRLPRSRGRDGAGICNASRDRAASRR